MRPDPRLPTDDGHEEHEVDAAETALRMQLRYALHDAFERDTSGAWRWLGRLVGRPGQVPPVFLSRDELERAIGELAARSAPAARSTPVPAQAEAA